MTATLPNTAESPLKLPFGRSEAEALVVAKKHRELIWHGAAGKGLDEEGKTNLLIETCTEMCDWDRASGEELARRAVWSPS